MNQSRPKPLTIGALAKRAGVRIDTVRFYERRGLLPEPSRTSAGYRTYRDETINRIQFIRRAKTLGFSLDEIQKLLGLQDSGGAKADVKQLATSKLAQVDDKIADLNRIREVLDTLSAKCSGTGTVNGCPIIEALADSVVDDDESVQTG